MNTKISEIKGVGPLICELLNKAGFVTIYDAKTALKENIPYAQKMQDVLEDLKMKYDRDTHGYWQRVVNVAVGVLTRIGNGNASPFIPEFFMCPIGLDWMLDPVMTIYGDSYDRMNIIEHVKRTGRDFSDVTRVLDETMIFTNKELKRAIDYYRQNHMSLQVPVCGVLQSCLLTCRFSTLYIYKVWLGA